MLNVFYCMEQTNHCAKKSPECVYPSDVAWKKASGDGRGVAPSNCHFGAMLLLFGSFGKEGGL